MIQFNLNFLIASTVFACLILFGLFNILLILRKKFSVKVNCWFCNTNLRVPYDNWNSFTCPGCQQYNGFTDEGNYNQEIPEQHYSKLNTNQYCQRSFSERLPTNGFCEFCSRNQELKIHQLANFRPRCEEKHDEEIEEFKNKLEDSYQLCHSCQSHLHKTLNKIKTKFIGSKLSQLNAKLNNLNLRKTAKIIVEDGKFFSYFIISLILLLSIANFMKDMKLQLPSTNERLSNILNHLQVFFYTVADMITNWMKDMKLDDLTEHANIDKIATSALILNLILIFNHRKTTRRPVIASMTLWSVKMMINEIPVDESHEMSINGTMAVILIISSIFMFKETKKEQLDMNSSSFHKIPTENYEESDAEVDYSDTCSLFDSQSNKTTFTKASRLNSSYRSAFTVPVKTLNSTFRPNVDIVSNKSFSIAKEVLTADRRQVQNDINRLRLSDNADDVFSTSSTIKEFNSSQLSNPFMLADDRRSHSPAPSVASLFSTSTRHHLASPPRLHSPMVYTNSSNTSWIGGGYWQSPQKKYLNVIINQSKPVMSRSSSQSSGLGTIDDSDKNSRDDSPENAASLFSDVTSHRKNLFEMPPNRSIFAKTAFLNPQKNCNNLFSSSLSHSSFGKYRDSNGFFK